MSQLWIISSTTTTCYGHHPCAALLYRKERSIRDIGSHPMETWKGGRWQRLVSTLLRSTRGVSGCTRTAKQSVVSTWSESVSASPALATSGQPSSGLLYLARLCYMFCTSRHDHPSAETPPSLRVWLISGSNGRDGGSHVVFAKPASESRSLPLQSLAIITSRAFRRRPPCFGKGTFCSRNEEPKKQSLHHDGGQTGARMEPPEPCSAVLLATRWVTRSFCHLG